LFLITQTNIMKNIITFLCLLLSQNISSNANTITTTQCNSYVWNGTTYTTSGAYSYTYLISGGLTATDYLLLTINYSSYSSSNATACNYYTWTNGTTYITSGTYTYTTMNSYGCDSILTLNLSMNNGVRISPKAFLFGAYDSISGLMKDSLRAVVIPGYPIGAIIPSSPANFLPANSASISPGVLNIAGPNAIVDWVYVEIRDGSTLSLVASQHALIQRDGDVVGTDGVSSLYFPTVCPGNYYVSIKHRNHLGVMTASTKALTATTQLINFSTGTVWGKPGITTPARKQVGSVYTLIAGDANENRNVKYNGGSNDKNAIMMAIGFFNLNGTIYGYRNEDVNMDGKVRFNNQENDKLFFLNEVISLSPTGSPNEILSQHTP